MNTYAIIENGLIVNVIVWNGDTNVWQPPAGATAQLVEDGQCAIIGQPLSSSSTGVSN